MNTRDRINIKPETDLEVGEVCDVLLRARDLVVLVLNLNSNIEVKINGISCLILDFGDRELTYIEYDDSNHILREIDLIDFIQKAEFIEPYEEIENQRKQIAEVIDGIFKETDSPNDVIIDNFGLAKLCGVMISRGIHIPAHIFLKITNLKEYQEETQEQ